MRPTRSLAAIVTGAIVASSLVALTATPAQAASIGALAGAGPRPGATQLAFNVGDRVRAAVDVGSGNLYVTTRGLSLPGVNTQIEVGAFYNSAASDQTTVPRLGRGWGLDYTTDVRVVTNSDATVTYYGPGGLTGVFTPVSGSSTQFTSAPGFKSDLVKGTTGDFTLTERQSRTKRTFSTAGLLTSVVDRNSNTTSVTSAAGAGSYANLTVVTPAGPTNARTATVQTNTSNETTLRQPNVTTPRQAKFMRTTDTMTQYTDPLNRLTTFSYVSSGLMSSITAPGGVITNFSYDSSRRVSSITQVESATGGPGSSTTRLLYSSATQTLLAGPNTNQTSAVTAVPRTTYTLDSTQRVTSAVDEEGRTRSKTYTANFDTLSSSAGSGSTASTTTNVYGANNSESLTKSTTTGGASQSLTYATASPNQYLPSGGSDDAGNASTYTYNGSGNQLTSTNVAAAQAKVSYNSDGTAATATSPGNGTNATGYGYTNKQVTSVTPPTGTSLGARAFTYDQYGRTATATNGRGITTTYSYDVNDRPTAVSYSDGKVVTYDYDTAGRNDRRADTYGTTVYGYDALGRLTSRSNSAGGGTFTYTYDKASNLKTVVSTAGGTTSYFYDDANTPTYVMYPLSGVDKKLEFAVDNQGRRTDTWLNSSGNHTAWKAHQQTTYDTSGRPTRVTADQGEGDTDNTRIVDISYCYAAASIAPACSTATTADRSKLRWKKDNLTGAVTTYTYDTSARLTAAVVTVTGAKTYNYTYNINANRLTATGTGQPDQTLTFNPGNQISTTGYTYDGAGNLTSDPSAGAVAYTSADQLSSVTRSGTTYNYRHAGTTNDELVYQTTPDGTYQYAYGRTNSLGQPILESVTKDSLVASITSDPVTGQPLLLRTSSGMQSLYVYDGRAGSPIALITSAPTQAFAYEYDPYGMATLTADSGGLGTSQNPYLFAGGVQDRTTGWIHYGARYYSPSTATFTQQDSLDAPLDPANGNRYAYAANDPVNNTDPTGNGVGGKTALVYGGLGLACGIAGLATGGAGFTACGVIFSSAGFIIGGICELPKGKTSEC